MIDLSEDFWGYKYKKKKTGWDLGMISTPLKEYFDQIEDKNLKILIPGAGNSYEAEYLFNQGFENVFVVDIAIEPLNNLKGRVMGFPDKHLIHNDFFNLEGTFDLIIEQTFFCAINPENRSNYAKKVYDLLKDEGKLVGLLFEAKLNDNHPPFGGSKKEYVTYFSSFFDLEIIELCYNSIGNRKGMELFIKFKKVT